jgi:hypothetical protein
MNAPKSTGRFPVLDELGGEFERVAREDSVPRRRFHLRRTALAVAVALVVVPAGYALAQSAGDTGTEGGDLTQTAVDLVRNDPQIAARVGLTPIETNSLRQSELINILRQREAEIEALRQKALQHPEDKNIIGGSLPPALVEQCRANPNSDDLCGIALAVEDGKLKPGTYTDAELQDAVRAAGYEWTPAPP